MHRALISQGIKDNGRKFKHKIGPTTMTDTEHEAFQAKRRSEYENYINERNKENRNFTGGLQKNRSNGNNTTEKPNT